MIGSTAIYRKQTPVSRPRSNRLISPVSPVHPISLIRLIRLVIHHSQPRKAAAEALLPEIMFFSAVVFSAFEIRYFTAHWKVRLMPP
ncbi:hypothetical protein EST62_10300 [Chlorobaculum sp. 24CR]|uniref:hypothetical protein n=1 Tax=Chlorobaculum sp. 24CR TaxID=2508878 RepID=UPI00100B5DF8|nr:hypothetical protein [Chlorobaculum sp. 24CR]RXK82580.1 hypothetical protein EST62_10300 [Chlorobaculum sp. 24CR]